MCRLSCIRSAMPIGWEPENNKLNPHEVPQDLEPSTWSYGWTAGSSPTLGMKTKIHAAAFSVSRKKNEASLTKNDDASICCPILRRKNDPFRVGSGWWVASVTSPCQLAALFAGKPSIFPFTPSAGSRQPWPYSTLPMGQQSSYYPWIDR